MYPSKVPGITVEIERRIRQSVYSDKLPPVSVLQTEFSAALKGKNRDIFAAIP